MIDGVTAAVKMVESLLALGLGTSKYGDLAYPNKKAAFRIFRTALLKAALNKEVEISMQSATDKPFWHFTADYPRDMAGYAGKPPLPDGWRAYCGSVCPNFEEGGENHVLHGDSGSEQFLSDIIGAASYPARHMSMDSLYEYGSRAGFWRIHRSFRNAVCR